MRQLIVGVVCGLVGLVVGCFATLFYVGETVSDGIGLLSESVIYRNEEAAFDAYANEPREVGVWALSNYAELLRKEDVRLTLGDRWHCEMLVTLARLSKLLVAGGEAKAEHLNEIVDQAKNVAGECPHFASDEVAPRTLIDYAERVDRARADVREDEGGGNEGLGANGETGGDGVSAFSRQIGASR